MKVTVEQYISGDVVDGFYRLYRDAFEPLRTLAAARHVLTAQEFAEEMADKRVDKYVVWDDEGSPVALSTLTNDMSAVPWIEPAYFEARYPEQAARGALFYLGFTLVHPDHHGRRVFKLATDALIERLIAERAVVSYDICAHNDTVRMLGRSLERVQKSKAAVTVSRVDVQTYYTADYRDAV